LGGYALTLIDALDTLALLGNKTEFARGVRWVANNVNFDIDKTVSLFETNIRIMGGLLAGAYTRSLQSSTRKPSEHIAHIRAQLEHLRDISTG
jgi:hypothetical protein